VRLPFPGGKRKEFSQKRKKRGGGGHARLGALLAIKEDKKGTHPPRGRSSPRGKKGPRSGDPGPVARGKGRRNSRGNRYLAASVRKGGAGGLAPTTGGGRQGRLSHFM